MQVTNNLEIVNYSALKYRDCVAHLFKKFRNLSGKLNSEISETIGVVILMGGGPFMVNGCEALEALDQFEVEQDLQL